MKNGKTRTSTFDVNKNKPVEFSDIDRNTTTPRPSVLTELSENPHFRATFHVYAIALISLFFDRISQDFGEYGRFNRLWHLFKNGFRGMGVVLVGWSVLLALSCLVYFCFKIWTELRPRHGTRKYEVLALVTYYSCCFYFCSKLILVFDVSFASSTILLLEQVRLAMKVHSFVKANAAKRNNNDTKDFSKTTFSHYLYYLFAPTLIYKDTYARTNKSIRWIHVGCYLLQITAGIVALFLIIDRFLTSDVKDFCRRTFTLNEVFLIICSNMAVGFMFLVTAFFLKLHSFQNLFGEILKFDDRTQFYGDWWTSTCYSVYFRKWNSLVHKWLHIYVYQEVYNARNMVWARFLTFLFSGLVHEWVLACLFGFLFPLCFISFVVVGFLLTFVHGPKTPLFNLIFLSGLTFGGTSLIVMYIIEYYARFNAPVKNPTFLDSIFPRFLSCGCIMLS